MAAKVWQVWQPLAGAVKALPIATAQKLDLGRVHNLVNTTHLGQNMCVLEVRARNSFVFCLYVTDDLTKSYVIKQIFLSNRNSLRIIY